MKIFPLIAGLLVFTNGVVVVSGAQTHKGSLTQEEALKHAKTINRLLNLEYDRNGVEPNPLVDDAVFVRRAFLGIVGRIPTVDEATEFLANEDADKRVKLVDHLSASRGYESHQFNFMADLLRLQTNRERHGVPWHLWIESSIREDKPFDDFVGEMISASGHVSENPAVGYYLRDRGMLLDNVSTTVQTFLGVRMGCAQCHDHPFDDWTQRDFFEIAAFSADVDYKSELSREMVQEVKDYLQSKEKVTDPRELLDQANAMKGKLTAEQKRRKKELIKEAKKSQSVLKQKMKDYSKWGTRYMNQNGIICSETKVIRYPDDYKYNDANPKDVVEAFTPFGAKIEEEDRSKLRKEYAEWMVSPSNPYFTKTIANRLWRRTFGHGLADPVDDWSSGDAVIPYPELLKVIEELMVVVDFDLRQFQRILWHTELFQRAPMVSEVSELVPHSFAGPLLRRMTAEQLMDSMLTLYVGNPDELENERIEEVWAEHEQTLSMLKNASGKEMVEMVDQFVTSYDERERLKTEGRRLALEVRQAAAKNESRKVNELKKKIADLKQRGKMFSRDQRTTLLFALDRQTLRVPNGGGVKMKNLARVSEMSTPYQANSFVRQFGSSDRNLSDNANTKASVPQVLNLMNGQITGLLTSRDARYLNDLKAYETGSDQLSHFYLALYATMPTEEERAEFTDLMTDKKDRILFSRAALNSKRFLFIQ